MPPQSTPPSPSAPQPPAARPAQARRRFGAGLVPAFHAYAGWLVGISWTRFALMSVLLLVLAQVLQGIPPFTWTLSETVRTIAPPEAPSPPVPPVPPEPPGRAPTPPREEGGADPKALGDGVREALDEARQAIEAAVEEGRVAKQEALDEREKLPRTRVVRVHLGDFLDDLAFLLILTSAIVKITYKQRLQAEVKAAQAVETAEDESLKRQVVEARMAAMQAQVEPHFLFNTLASIDHLIETDPVRASAMQKHLIALLRAAMPTMREAHARGLGDLGRELELVRPYLELLKMRMEERLQAEVQVPEGLHSAECPPMMLQGLVENAIKHGLEPKAEGGRLRVRAEVVHGDLVLSVEDSGLGFGRARTAGTGVGLANIRERLQLLYGDAASLTLAENPGGGTRATITLPYRTRR